MKKMFFQEKVFIFKWEFSILVHSLNYSIVKKMSYIKKINKTFFFLNGRLKYSMLIAANQTLIYCHHKP